MNQTGKGKHGGRGTGGQADRGCQATPSVVIEIRHQETGRLLLRVDGRSLLEAPPDFLSYADLRGADLCGLDLSGIDLSHHDLTGADLGQANLIGTMLTEANLTGADLSGARFDQRTEWPDAFE